MWQSAHLRQLACHSKSGATRNIYWSCICEPQPTHIDTLRFSAKTVTKLISWSAWHSIRPESDEFLPRSYGQLKLWYLFLLQDYHWDVLFDVVSVILWATGNNTYTLDSQRKRVFQLTTRILQNSDLSWIQFIGDGWLKELVTWQCCHSERYYWSGGKPTFSQIGALCATQR